MQVYDVNVLEMSKARETQLYCLCRELAIYQSVNSVDPWSFAVAQEVPHEASQIYIEMNLFLEPNPGLSAREGHSCIVCVESSLFTKVSILLTPGALQSHSKCRKKRLR